MTDSDNVGVSLTRGEHSITDSDNVELSLTEGGGGNINQYIEWSRRFHTHFE